MQDRRLFEIQASHRVIFGFGASTRLESAVEGLGQHALLISSPEIAELGVIDGMIAAPAERGLEFSLYDQVCEEPATANIDALREGLAGVQPDFLIAVGGGSVLDTAKAIAIGLTHSEPIWEYVNLSNRPPLDIEPKTLPVIAIPTTAGTGSEVTPYSVISNPETSQKGTIKSLEIRPRVALVDPALTVTLPPDLTAATGIDAFAHALESYLNVSNRNHYSDMVAEEAIESLFLSLPSATRDGNDREHRKTVSWGSLMAGLAIANAGTTVAHALAQPLGAHTHLSHSLTVSLFTAPVLKRTWQAEMERLGRLARRLKPAHFSGENPERDAEGFVTLVEELFDQTGMRNQLEQLTFSNSLVEPLIADVTGYMARPLKQHPVVFRENDLRGIIEDALKLSTH